MSFDAPSLDSDIPLEKETGRNSHVCSASKGLRALPSIPPPAVSDSIPDGGTRAWLQVVGSFFLFFSSWGLVNTFGAFQTFYDSGALFKSSSSGVSWIGTVQGFLLISISGLTGTLFDKGYFRILTYVGTFLVVFGTMMTSISTKYYQVFLAQAICSGLGQGCIFVPSVAILTAYFSTHRALATGIGAAGSSVGGVIYPIVFHRLQSRIGFGWATRVLGFLSLATLSISLAVMKQRVLPKTARPLLDLSAFKSLPFDFFTLGLFFIFIGLYVPFFYMPSYAALVLHTSPDLAFYLIAVLNGSSAVGRVGLNFLADKIGPLNTLVPCAALSGILCFVWIGVRSSLGGLITLCILYGASSGAVVSLPPTVLAGLTPDLGMVGTRMGMSFMLSSFGLLIGSPIAGTLLNMKEAKFETAQAFAGATLIIGAAFMGLAWVTARRGSSSWRI
ncbi:MAG: hypothetical protein M1814_001514 [Vezdaea aestivalis]|nr:MAG: hypothetical protein M1814_001514 [Vezdaea aestivalis]